MAAISGPEGGLGPIVGSGCCSFDIRRRLAGTIPPAEVDWEARFTLFAMSVDFLHYGGQFAGATFPVSPELDAIYARPADPRTVARMAQLQRETIETVAPRLHRQLYEIGIDNVLADGRPASRAILENYAAKMGRPVTDEQMVAPKGIQGAGLIYESRDDHAPFYRDVETVRRLLKETVSPETARNLVASLSRIRDEDGNVMPVPVLTSVSTGGNVIVQFNDPQLPEGLFPELEAGTPVVALVRRSGASSFAGMFGTFGGAAMFKERDKRTHIVTVVGSDAGARSTTARELHEEANLSGSAFKNIVVLAQHDMQLSTGATQLIELPFGEVVKRANQAQDRREFQDVIAVPLELEHLTAMMCAPTVVEGKPVFAPRMPSWSAQILVDAFGRHAGRETQHELATRIATPETMEAAYSALPPGITQAMNKAMNERSVSLA